MSKINISRLLDTSKMIKTEAGKQLEPLINYTSDMAEQVLRSLKNGLTFEDNINSSILTVGLVHNTSQEINTNNRTPTGVLIRRVLSTTDIPTGLLWYLNDSGNLIVKVLFSTANTSIINVELIVTF